MKLTFLGATETVTGSKYLLEEGTKKILIDCGLFQGHKELRLRNWDLPIIDPTSVDAIILTHAHIDHSGYIPCFVKAGFKGPIYCSRATYDLCKILLPDSGHLQEQDTARANRYGYSKHHPALPLYTEQDALDCLRLFKPIDLYTPTTLGQDLTFSLHYAGHILGACFIHVKNNAGKSIIFSGDVGRLNNPVMKAPAILPPCDYVVLESTYGDRLHNSDDPTDEIGDIVNRTVARGGSVIIPSFAVGRAQSLLYHFYMLKKNQKIPNVPIYLDSPMSISATELLLTHMEAHKLSKDVCLGVSNVAIYTNTMEESKKLDEHDNMPKIIISASGMATGGRILHHLKHYLGDPKSTIVLAGFQAGGTRGDRLMRGEKEIKIHGQMWPVRAEIVQMDNMSSHADYNEILQWLEDSHISPSHLFITHGEATAAHVLKEKIIEKFGWVTTVPTYQQVELL